MDSCRCDGSLHQRHEGGEGFREEPAARGAAGRGQRERDSSKRKTAGSFILPALSSPGEKQSDVKMEIYTAFQKLCKKRKDPDEGFLFPGFVYKEQSSRPMKSIVGTVITNSPRIILRQRCSRRSLRGEKNYRYA